MDIWWKLALLSVIVVIRRCSTFAASYCCRRNYSISEAVCCDVEKWRAETSIISDYSYCRGRSSAGKCRLHCAYHHHVSFVYDVCLPINSPWNQIKQQSFSNWPLLQFYMCKWYYCVIFSITNITCSQLCKAEIYFILWIVSGLRWFCFWIFIALLQLCKAVKCPIQPSCNFPYQILISDYVNYV